ncbi:MAG TPA: hypothetical protein VMC08_01865 [Bacteroidales bacterium]|nr:hypothetical protein [Bacteroidales bacterium]
MEEQSGKPKSNRIYLYALILLVIILLAWVFIQRSQLTKLVNEKEGEKIALQHELDSVVAEHNKIKQEYGALSDSLAAKDSVIQADAIQIRRLLDTQWEYNKVRKRLGMLQQIAQGYVRQIDSLYTVNRQLEAENEKVRQDYHNEQAKTQSLMKDKEELNEKMNQAAILRAYDVTVTPYKLKGGEKEQVTDKASRTDRLRVCFTIGENPLVQKGKKIIYVRITRPDNVVVQKTKYDNFMFNGQSLPYSLRQDIQWDGAAQNLCLVWTKRDQDKPSMKGTYSVTVFTEDKEIGTGTFTLK